MRRELRATAPHRAVRIVRAGCLALAMLTPSGAGAVSWEEIGGVDTVTITTLNEDETPRETTIWLIVLDSYPYIRTGNTHWGANAERNPDVKLRVGDKDYLLRAVPVRDPLLTSRLQKAFRDKYGWSDVVVGLLPGAGTKLFRLDLRPGS